MKIVVLNGSPRKNGNTRIMAETFAEGAKSKNHEVKILDIAHMNIKGRYGSCF